ncbi:MAG: N-acetylneuraminate synthase family protein [archaeon]
MKNFITIAEIGNTHIGKLQRAKKLINLAKNAGADVLKLQKRAPKECVPKKLWNKPHPNQKFSYGKNYIEHRINIELSLEEHKKIKKYCQKQNIEYSTSIWDLTSAKEIISLNPMKIKIPSACNYNKKIIEFLYDNFNGEIHISLGMTTKKERERFYNYIKKFNLNRFVIYHCTSMYPAPFKNIYLNEIKNLCSKYPKVGFSNHGYGIILESIAYTLGARYFERHFIDDRTFPHSDSAASLEPQGFNKMVRNLEATKESLKYKPNQLIKEEKIQRDKLRKPN